MQIPPVSAPFFAEAAKNTSNSRKTRNHLEDQTAANAEVALELRIITLREKNEAEDLVNVVDSANGIMDGVGGFLPGEIQPGINQLRSKISELSASMLDDAARQDGRQAAMLGLLESGRDEAGSVGPAEELAEMIAQVA